ncbi:MAG: hypothetical protein WCS87_18865 [Methylococcaceae bacterium]
MKKSISSTTIKSVVLVAGMAAFVAPAYASPVLTFSGFTYDGSGLDAGTVTDVSTNAKVITASSTTVPVVTTSSAGHTTSIPATPTTYLYTDTYSDVTTTTKSVTTTSSQDSKFYGLNVAGNTLGTDQYLEMFGSITNNSSSVAIFNYTLTAVGSFADRIFKGISLKPAAPTLAFLNNNVEINSSGDNTTFSPGTSGTYSVINSGVVSVAAGATVSWDAYVLSNGKTSFSDFGLTLLSPLYGLTTQNNSSSVTVSTLLSHVATIPAAVPLPAGVWLFMTGLMGVLYTGKKKAQRA